MDQVKGAKPLYSRKREFPSKPERSLKREHPTNRQFPLICNDVIVEILDNSSPEKIKIRKVEKVPVAIVASTCNDKGERIFFLKHEGFKEYDVISEQEARTKHARLLIKYYEERIVIPEDSDDD